MTKSFIASTLILILVLTVSFFMYVNTMVSLKYETEIGDCISNVDGRNLCQILKFSQIALGASLVLLIASLVMRNRHRNDDGE